MGYKDLLSYSSTIVTPCSLPINENTKQTFLNLESNIKGKNIMGFSFLQNFSRKKKDSNTTQTSFLMLDAKEVNSSTTIDSFSIKRVELQF
jgi:hypothetical protein